MTLAEVAARFHAIPRGKGFIAKCPTHDDSTPSLSIDPGDKGGVLVTCRADCPKSSVLAAVGLTLKDLAPPNGQPNGKEIVDVSEYTDEKGALLYQSVRFFPKDFKQRRPDGVGGWMWNLDGVRRVLFRLPHLKGPRVWLTEGEKDAKRVCALGLNATTAAGGASAKWESAYTEQLKAAGVTEVCILPDNDKPGLKRPDIVAAGLAGSGITLRTILLPGLPVKGDVSDWLDAGHTRAELEALAVAKPMALSKSTAPTILDLERNDRNVPKSNLANAVAVLQQDPMWGPDYLWFDAFLDRVITKDPTPRQWTDEDDTRCAVYMQQTIGMLTISENQVASAVRYVARQRVRHCVREHVRLVPWDGVERIAHALEDFFGAEPSSEQPSPYLRAVSANLFIGLIARIERPGCQLDTMVILEGPQGIGKSSALRIIGGEWYALGSESVTSKDFYQTLPGKWLMELGELDSIGRAERERIKIAISTPIDRYRASYGRHAADHARQCVFVGTTNRDDYGHDDTGLRRFWPVRCGAIDLEALTVACPQLFAEALACFQAGATWWEVPTTALDVQRDRQSEDIWTAPILAWCTGKTTVTSSEVAAGALSMRAADMDRATQLRISSVLRLAGWTRKTIRRPGELPVKGFAAPVTDE